MRHAPHDSRGQESCEALGEKVAIRSKLDASRELETAAVQLLQSMSEHRAVDLAQHIVPDVHSRIRIDAED